MNLRERAQRLEAKIAERNAAGQDERNAAGQDEIEREASELAKYTNRQTAQLKYIDQDAVSDEQIQDDIFASKQAGVWKDALRDAAISTDKMYAFVELMAGYMGEEATAVTTSEEPHLAELSKLAKQQRADISKRVYALQGDLIKAIVDSVMKQSSLQASTDKRFGSTEDDPMVVVDGDLKKQIEDLASGESGRPFFEANVALRNVMQNGEKKGTSMVALAEEVTAHSHSTPRFCTELTALAVLRDQVVKVVSVLRSSLIKEMESHLQDQSGGIDLASLPRNSYHIKLRPDAVAAIRTAHERMTTEMGGKRVPLWVLVEGKDSSLTTKFAQFCGQILTHIRMSSGPSSVYIGLQKANANVINLKISLSRLVSHASASSAVAIPMVNEDMNIVEILKTRNAYFAEKTVMSSPSSSRDGTVYGIPVIGLADRVSRKTYNADGTVSPFVSVGVNANVGGWSRYPPAPRPRAWY